MRKRVAVARTLALGPEIILFDEPTVGLDPLLSNNVDELILGLKERVGCTNVVVTHDLITAFRVADRIGMFHEGDDHRPRHARRIPQFEGEGRAGVPRPQSPMENLIASAWTGYFERERGNGSQHGNESRHLLPHRPGDPGRHHVPGRQLQRILQAQGRITRCFFPHASGLNAGDPVAVAGLKVGKIKSLELKEDGVLMTLAIDPKIRIRKDAVASIAWGGLLGNRYIDISLGKPDQPWLEPGSEIHGGTTIELTAVLFKINAAATDFQDMLKTSGAGSKVQTMLDNLAKASADIAKVTEDIREHRGTVGKLIGSDELYNKAMGIADDLKGASADVRKLLGRQQPAPRIPSSKNSTPPSPKRRTPSPPSSDSATKPTAARASWPRC